MTKGGAAASKFRVSFLETASPSFRFGRLSFSPRIRKFLAFSVCEVVLRFVQLMHVLYPRRPSASAGG
jgi:hypothetical protein